MSAVRQESGDVMPEQMRQEADISISDAGVASSLNGDDGETRGQVASLALTPTRSSRGPLRINGIPHADDRSGPSRHDEIAAMLAKLAGEVAHLRSEKNKTISADAQAEARVRKDVAAIKDSIEHLEAFVSIGLAAKLDQMIGTKLAVLQKVEASKRRLVRWLTAFVVITLVLVAAMVLEARTGQVFPMLDAFMLTVTDTASVIVHGAAIFVGIVQDFVKGLRV